MKITDMFPSKYLKCADLQGRQVKVIIDRVEEEFLGDDKKPVVYFRNKTKGLVANRTNCNTIADMHGDETRNWPGKEITLYPTRVDFKGERVDTIRVEFVQPLPIVAPPTQPAPTARLSSADMARPAQHQDDMSDSIPF